MAKEGMHTATCSCGWTSLEYGTLQAALDALSRHRQYENH